MSSTTKSTVTTGTTSVVLPSHLADSTGLDFLIPCMNVGDSLTGVREAVAWTVAAVSMVLFSSITRCQHHYAVAEVQEKTGQGQLQC